MITWLGIVGLGSTEEFCFIQNLTISHVPGHLTFVVVSDVRNARRKGRTMKYKARVQTSCATAPSFSIRVEPESVISSGSSVAQEDPNEMLRLFPKPELLLLVVHKREASVLWAKKA